MAQPLASLVRRLESAYLPLGHPQGRHRLPRRDLATAAGGVGGADIGVQLELLAQAHIDGAEPAGDRSCQQAFQRQLGLPDAVDQLAWQRIAGGLNAGEPALLPVPFERGAERVQDGDDGLRDFRPDPSPRISVAGIRPDFSKLDICQVP